MAQNQAIYGTQFYEKMNLLFLYFCSTIEYITLSTPNIYA